MHSDAVPSLPHAAPEPAPPPTAAARRRALRRPRHPGPRPTNDPPTEWRNRPATWTTLPWPALEAALPGAVPIPFTGASGETHPFEAAVALAWPVNGLLTTPRRRTWNGRPMTAGPAAGLLQPRRIAQALHATLSASRLGEPRHWDAGTTTHGEWWALRARYPKPAGHPAAGEPVETVVTARHRIGSTELRLQSGWRLPGSGAEIVTGDYPVRIRRGRITLQQSPQYNLPAGIADEIDASSRLLTAWSTEAVTRSTLTSWAATVISPKTTHTVAATLIALYDRRRQHERPRAARHRARRRLDRSRAARRSPRHRTAHGPPEPDPRRRQRACPGGRTRPSPARGRPARASTASTETTDPYTPDP